MNPQPTPDNSIIIIRFKGVVDTPTKAYDIPKMINPIINGCFRPDLSARNPETNPNILVPIIRIYLPAEIILANSGEVGRFSSKKINIPLERLHSIHGIKNNVVFLDLNIEPQETNAVSSFSYESKNNGTRVDARITSPTNMICDRLNPKTVMNANVRKTTMNIKN